MQPMNSRPLGGRFAEWLDGRPIVASDVLPKRTVDGRVITEPLPVRVPQAVPSHEAPPCEPLLTTPFFPPLVPQPEGQAAGPPASKRRPAEIKEHPAADKLLAALSSYQRPYLVEETPESAGHPAASYAGAPRALSPGLPTPPREPRTKLTDSLVQEIDDRKTLAARSAIARQAPTVMTRAFAATTERQADESPPPDAVGARPRRRGLPLVLVGGAVVGILAFVGFLALAGRTRSPPPVVAPAPTGAPMVEAATSASSAQAASAVPTAESIKIGDPQAAAPPPAAVLPLAPPRAPAPRADVLVVPAASSSALSKSKPHSAPTPEPSSVPSSSISIKPTFQVQN